MAQRNPIEDEPQFKVVHGYGEESPYPNAAPLDEEDFGEESSLLPFFAGIILLLAVLGMVAWWWTSTGGV
ncbi:MAG: hypothetical protein WAO58_11035 [Fimbriimonadaceae bacterium]